MYIGVPQGSPLSSTLLIAFPDMVDSLELADKKLKFSAYANNLVIYSDVKENLKKKNQRLVTQYG